MLAKPYFPDSFDDYHIIPVGANLLEDGQILFSQFREVGFLHVLNPYSIPEVCKPPGGKDSKNPARKVVMALKERLRN